MAESPLVSFFEEFNSILQKVSPIWKSKILGKYKCHGRRFALSRIIQQLEPLLSKAMPLPKERSLSQEAVMYRVDATEQSIERPSQGQQGHYSGKKKQKLPHDSRHNWIRSNDSEDRLDRAIAKIRFAQHLQESLRI